MAKNIKNEDNTKNLRKAQYLLGLLGKKRTSTSKVIDEFAEIQLDALHQMVEQETSLENEIFTSTIQDQIEVERSVKHIYNNILETGELPTLSTRLHVKFLKSALGSLPPMFISLDASQPWILYWSINSLYVLGKEDLVTPELKDQASKKILSLIHPNGGIGGGIGQLGHAAASFAAFSTLALIGDEQVWAQIDKTAVYEWLLSLKQKDGSFVMHIDGEKDTRAVYCVLVIASLLNIITPKLIEGTAEWLSQCQTFEGGFGGVPFDEAHGGYTFCATAALLILGKDTLIEYAKIDKLLHWVVFRQLSLEGGFSGRSNKLVDGCYSFWVGGIVPIFDLLLEREVVSRASLQNYILACCQNEKYGGLLDKPGKHPDFYHSNYVLLGLSITQSRFQWDEQKLEAFPSKTLDKWVHSITTSPIDPSVIDVKEGNLVKPINPVFGLPLDKATNMKEYFSTR